MTLAGLAYRNVRRSKLRVLFTLLAIAVAVMTFVMLQTIQTAWSSVRSNAAADHLVTQDATSYAVLMPRRYADDVRSLPHVKNVTFTSWFGGTDPAHEREFFPSLAVDPDTYFEVFEDIGLTTAELAAWHEKRNAVIVGDALAAKLSWKVGDRIGLESGFYPEQPLWQLEIVGIYEARSRSVGRSNVFLRWDYFNELAADWHDDRIGWIISQVDDPSRTAEVAGVIDRHLESLGGQTFTQDEQAYMAQFEEGMFALMRALDLACLGILGITILLVGNTIAMGVRERAHEYGTLRAIGFPASRLIIVVLGEAAIIGMLGSGLGLAAASVLINAGLGAFVERSFGAFLPYFRVEPSVAVSTLIVMVVSAVIAALLPASKLSSMHVSDALRQPA